ncbi:putative secreted protein [Verrucomicrobia bacterium]|nr:putative secreted protein [Verrucomicrobiota bacterium]
MNKLPFALVLAVALGTCRTVARADTPALDPHLEKLRPLLEKTWKGSFKDSKPEHPAVDVARWERALNGRAIRILHSFNDGVYGGETLIFWDKSKQSLVYHYFTTASHDTIGTLTVEDGKFITHEVVEGDTSGVSEVKATSELLPDGTFHVKSEYLKNGQWVPGHEVAYREDANAKVVFR